MRKGRCNTHEYIPVYSNENITTIPVVKPANCGLVSTLGERNPWKSTGLPGKFVDQDRIPQCNHLYGGINNHSAANGCLFRACFPVFPSWNNIYRWAGSTTGNMWLAQVPGDRWGLVPLRKMCETREFERDEMISHYHCMVFIVFTTDVVSDVHIFGHS